jgi:hypothetical protein
MSVEAHPCDHPPRRLRSWLGGNGPVVACLACQSLLVGSWKWKFRPGVGRLEESSGREATFAWMNSRQTYSLWRLSPRPTR